MVVPFVAGHGDLHSCSSWAWVLLGIWDLPKSGIELVSLALQGRFLTTESPGKPLYVTNLK